MIAKKIFSADGSNIRFLSDFIIRSEQFTRVYNYMYDVNGVDGDVDPSSGLYIRTEDVPNSNDLITIDKWDLVDNSISFYTAPYSGSRVYIEVATTSEEFGDTLVQPSVEKAEAAAAESEASATASALSEANAAASADSIASQDAQITTNTTNIDTNTTNIGTNTANIDTNTTNIGNNTSAIATKLSLSGGTVTGQVKGITPVSAEDLTRKDYVDTKAALSGATFTGQVKGITPVVAEDLTRKDYVDAKTASILSGTFTPAIVDGANITSSVIEKSFYTRVGNIVTMHVHLYINTIVEGDLTSIHVDLPIASSFAVPEDLSGVVSSGAAGNTFSGEAYADNSNNRMTVVFYSGAPFTADIHVSASYEIA